MPRTGLMCTCLGPVVFGVRAGGQIRGATISLPLSGGSVSWRRVSCGRVVRLVCVVVPSMLIGRSGGGREGAAQMVSPSDSSLNPCGVPFGSERSWVEYNWYKNCRVCALSFHRLHNAGGPRCTFPSDEFGCICHIQMLPHVGGGLCEYHETDLRACVLRLGPDRDLLCHSEVLPALATYLSWFEAVLGVPLAHCGFPGLLPLTDFVWADWLS